MKKIDPTDNLPIIRQIPPTLRQVMLDARNTEREISHFKMGRCHIIRAQSPMPSGQWLWHLSISHPERLPTWEEVKKARYELLPDEVTIAMLLPPKREWVNLHEFCFHLWQVDPDEVQS